ncbi:DUF4430 domain-containing protein [Cohnella thailandensis]|uniref:DUF4430 domain-containing protein n=1 Tax=Cohnella thailandensis TaxID=557557 RepID=A0A841T1Q2_9BACL|nr:DUF4430 domain-containing protein [Cohnella thailandensis]MBB6636979.1 DUF4430 domain-containing protein [Cohnella thailandensis]MBP1973138.1 hypothetical protein [Cohnella thailandensis]
MKMTPKKWLVAAGIVCVLALAFYWGGDRPSGKSDSTEPSSAAASSTIEANASPFSSPDSSPATAKASEESAAQGTGGLPAESETEPESEPSSSPTQHPEEQAAIAESPAPGKESTAKPSEQPASPKPSASPSPSPSKGKPAANPSSSASPSESGGKKDQYQTDPIPEGKPEPIEPQDAVVDKKKAMTATLSVSAKTILDNLDMFNEDKLEVLPDDGVIYAARKVTFYEGESVFDVLLREMKKNKIHMEFSMTPIYNSNYIEGINNIYEFDCGELSGWMYKVNGWFPNYGSSRYQLKDGDVVEWVYTCDLGRDVGGEQAAGAQT